ncbi:MAG: SDR family oxidoreductase [Pseudomonadota bacterium]
MSDYKPATKTSTDATYPSLAGRVALVTGGGSGIGAAIVEHLAGQGVTVGFIDIAEGPSRELADRLGDAVHFVKADLTDVDALRAAVDEIATRFGPIGILVNNAAHDERHALEDVTSDYWDKRLAVNLKPQFFAAQAVVPHMRKLGQGVIICVGSTSWMIGKGGMAGYTAAKAGVEGLMRSLADDLGGDNIRVLSLAPGWVMTERQKNNWVGEGDHEAILEHQTVKREIVPEDIARPVLFLASDEAAMCANQCFIIDGGWL